MSRVRIAVAGAGLIGKRHIEEIDGSPAAELASIVDPGPAGPEQAEKYGVALHASLAEAFAADRPDGVILATPNRLHVDGGLQCVAAGVPVVVEKPIGDSVEAATRLVEAAEAAGVPLLTGHHRNYSAIMTAARSVVASGVLGRIVAVSGTALFHKPDDYFEAGGGWRREPGGGPVLLNLVHEVNALLALVGDVVRVQAVTSSATRGFPVEDTAAILFTFANGALGTFLLSDTAASARSWEHTSRENSDYPTHADEDCYHIAGTTGSLSIPTMRVLEYRGSRSWYERFHASRVSLQRTDPLAAQIAHFAAVIRGDARPICSGRDGLRTLQVVDAVLEAARTGLPVEPAA
ncbi:Gfo/Idh/MocA family protein [Pseudonocardia broussonetiae]|uniref:Gfo/Idh/MocA family oxidoreductase n=1 Tax=Pseudonocardia broussonetiae TaxID=2736640 RepID=A0A6M6JLU6_9PSEU|nr:Gfo/Idh/MocA family oxidoreductase [Pseudonocardia broussonetiae]QJY48918.1 Gfo/Idh/MocA family oxidoreductase [Pseudonocardia broussonetiae]